LRLFRLPARQRSRSRGYNDREGKRGTKRHQEARADQGNPRPGRFHGVCDTSQTKAA
jgi:hypothetical protein